MIAPNPSTLFLPRYADHANPLDALAEVTSEYEGLSDESISTRLSTKLRKLVKEFDRDDYPELTMSNPNHRWRVVSGIQKAIRRGDLKDAIRPGIAIENSTQYTSFWRRLGVVVLEDIALANPELVALTLMVAGKAKWREKHGGDLITIALLDRMVQSVKSRALCNMACWLSASERFAPWRESWVKIDLDAGTPEHRAMLARYLAIEPAVDDCIPALPGDDAPASWAFATLASGVAAGHRKWKTTQTNPETNEDEEVEYTASGSSALHEALMEQAQPDLPTLWRYILRRARGMRLEGLMHAVPAAYRALYTTEAAITSDDIPETERVGHMPGYAFDRHTYEGKRAITTLMKTCEPVRAYLQEHVPEQHHLEALGFAVFFGEAGEPLSPKLQCAGHEGVLRSELAAYAAKYEVDLEVYLGLMGTVLANLPALNAARRKSLGIPEA